MSRFCLTAATTAVSARTKKLEDEEKARYRSLVGSVRRVMDSFHSSQNARRVPMYQADVTSRHIVVLRVKRHRSPTRAARDVTICHVTIYTAIIFNATSQNGSRGFTATALFTLTFFAVGGSFAGLRYFEDAGQRLPVRDVATIVQYDRRGSSYRRPPPA